MLVKLNEWIIFRVFIPFFLLLFFWLSPSEFVCVFVYLFEIYISLYEVTLEIEKVTYFFQQTAAAGNYSNTHSHSLSFSLSCINTQTHYCNPLLSFLFSCPFLQGKAKRGRIDFRLFNLNIQYCSSCFWLKLLIISF